MELVYLDGKKEPYTTSEIIAECAEVQHHTVTRLLRNHKERFEAFGFYGFEIHKLDGKGRPKKVYHLNEQQATLLITYLDNTPQVVKFKTNLVKAFFEMRDEVTEFRYQRALEKSKHKELTQAIKEWRHFNRWSYKAISDLLLKAITGQTAKQLKQSRTGYKIALDCLSAEELSKYRELERKVIVLLELNAEYDDIKKLVL
ncbi:Rha family transcriptional regulator [Streptococcus pluranimalium]|uniref:Rha family transcriptional regulator n=1 Tax=Streptococcus pluranimalium TaxID=82348 RepID=UPI0039FD516F